MAKRFTAIIIIANLIMGLLLYLSSQFMLSEINGFVLTGYSLSQIDLAPVQTGQVIHPIAMTMANFPFYVLLLLLIVNACFIIKLLISKDSKPNSPTS
jgi:hypothetical protein